MRQKIIGIMGPGQSASEKEYLTAYEMGQLIAKAGHILLTGGVDHGVMASASKGAKEAGGTTVGILPYKKDSTTHPISKFVDIPIITNIGESRNIINVMSCDIVVVIGMSTGTATEACHAVKNKIPVILLENSNDTLSFLAKTLKGDVCSVSSPKAAMLVITTRLK